MQFRVDGIGRQTAIAQFHIYPVVPEHVCTEVDQRLLDPVAPVVEITRSMAAASNAVQSCTVLSSPRPVIPVATAVSNAFDRDKLHPIGRSGIRHKIADNGGELSRAEF